MISIFSHLTLSSSGPRAYPEELLGADEGGRGGPSHRPQGQGEDSDVVEDEDDCEFTAARCLFLG